MNIFLFFLDDGLDALVKDKYVSIIFLDNFADEGMLIKGLSGWGKFVLRVIYDLFEFI